MDRDAILNQFNRIEHKISQLLDKCNRLESANNELQLKNDALIKQIEEKNAAEKQNDEIKSLVISKIDGLMGKLNEFTEE